MSLIHEIYTGTDLSFASSSKNLSRVLYASSKPVHQSALPERALLRRITPNTPVTLGPPKYATRHQKDSMTRISGNAAPNRDDNGGISGNRASIDDRLPVVQLQPFTRKEWRPSNSIPISSSSSSSSSLSLSSVTSPNKNLLLTRTLTCSEFAKREKMKRLPGGESFAVELSLPKHKRKTTLTPADNRQFSKSKSAAIGVSRDRTFLLPQPSTSAPATDLAPKVKRTPTTVKPGPHAIRRSFTTIASDPVRDGKRLTLTGTALSVTSPSSSFIHDFIHWDSYRGSNATRESGKTRSTREDCSPMGNHLSSSEVFNGRSKTLDSIAVLPNRLSSKRTTNLDSSYGAGPSPMNHFGVTNSLNPLNQQKVRRSGVESQLACFLRVTLEQTRRTQPGLGLVNSLPSCFRSYEALVESTYGEDRIRSGMRHNARGQFDAKTKRTGLKGKRTILLPPQGPTRNYTLPDLFHFLRDSEDDADSQPEARNAKEGISEERMAYNSRRTSCCSSRTSGSSAADVAMDTASLGNAIDVKSKAAEGRNSVLSSISSQSDNFREETENCRLTSQNEEMSMKTVLRKTGLIVTVPVATAPTEKRSLETETMATHLREVVEDITVETDSAIGGKMDAKYEMLSLEAMRCGDNESDSKMHSGITDAEPSSIPDPTVEKPSREMETTVLEIDKMTNNENEQKSSV